jgi:cytochrome oxidase Cu insertion factor (SCO1/SenC/PrrC family)
VSPRTINRLKLLGIGALALAPVLGSYLLYWFWLPENHTNYGTLIEPRSLPSAAMTLTDDKPFGFEQLRGRWVFVVVDGGDCGARCQEKLWTIRQVRQAQGKEMGRVERVWLIDDDKAPSAEVVRDYAGTWFVRSRSNPTLAAFPAERSNRDHVYLVDPRGNVMLRFPKDPEPKLMIKDIGRLLKYSSIG